MPLDGLVPKVYNGVMMEEESKDNAKKTYPAKEIEEMTLLMLYLTGWQEQVGNFPKKFTRSWKGYPFDALAALHGKSYINDSVKSKSVTLTDEGLAEAKRLMVEYLNG